MKNYVAERLRLVSENRAALMIQALARSHVAQEKFKEKKEEDRKRQEKKKENLAPLHLEKVTISFDLFLAFFIVSFSTFLVDTL